MDTQRRDTGRGVRPQGSATVGLGASALGAAAAAGSALLALACARHVRHSWDAGVLDGAVEVFTGLETLAVGSAGLVAAWVAALLLLGAVASLPGHSTAPLRSTAARLAPRLAPRVSALLVTVAVTALPVGSAHAQSVEPVSGRSIGSAHALALGPEDGGPGWVGRALHPGAASGNAGVSPGTRAAQQPTPDPTPLVPEPGWRPTAPPASPDPSAISLVSRGGAAPDAVVVRAGDTLWDIAARHLGDDADAAAIASAWPRWYAANRTVIGADPDRILPGTHLVPPGATS